MDITGAALPFFESAPGGSVHAGLGFSGHGLTGTKLGGKILASLVLCAPTTSGAACPSSAPPRAAPARAAALAACADRRLAYEASDRAHEQGGARGCCRAPSSPATAGTPR